MNNRNRNPKSLMASSSSSAPSSAATSVAPPVLDRFHVLLKESEDDLRVSDDEEDGGPVVGSDEIVRLYEVVLSELTHNSKPIITELTVIADEQSDHAQGIADLICNRIIEAPVDQKLPSFYLLDSIVKNHGREYMKYFAARLAEVFCEAYRQVHPDLQLAMRYLFGTWSICFPPIVLRKIASRLQFPFPSNPQPSVSKSLMASESPSRPAHGIHVNPMYLDMEARRQLKHTSHPNNEEDARGISPKLRGVRTAFGFEEYDGNSGDIVPPRVGNRRLSSSGLAAQTSSAARILRSSSPSTLGLSKSSLPQANGFVKEKFPVSLERASPSNHGYGYEITKSKKLDGEVKDWSKTHWAEGISHRVESSSTYSKRNGFENHRPRAVVDAYEDFKGKGTSNQKQLHMKVDSLDVNSNGSGADTKIWQNTEEEEYVWESMSPTLANHSSSCERSTNPLLGNITTNNTGLGRPPPASIMGPDYRSDRSRADDSTIAVADGTSILGLSKDLSFSLSLHEAIIIPACGSIDKSTVASEGTQGEAAQVQASSHFTHEPWTSSHQLPGSSQQCYPEASGKIDQISFPASRFMPPSTDNVPDNSASFQRFLSALPRIDQTSYSSPGASPMWPPINPQSSHPPVYSPYLYQQRIRGQFEYLDSNKSLINPALSNSSSLPQQQQFEYNDRNGPSLNKFSLLPSQQVPNTLNGRSHGQAGFLLQQQLVKSQGPRERFIPPNHPQFMPQPFNPGNFQRPGDTNISPNQLRRPPFYPSSVTIHHRPHTHQLQGGLLPPLSRGPPSITYPMGPTSQNMAPFVPHPPGAREITGVLGNLMAHGLISLTPQASVQDPIALEFNTDLHKVRHEATINALYGDLPRQCKTCGLRFKSQEEHSSHMDWHVTKNRVAKNRKQKASRKWFVSTSLYLTGSEALGADTVPGFLPTETVMEKKHIDEMAVLADENQKVCDLCGEPFEDFYSHENEEWMYRGAVYLNVPDDSSTVDFDRSQLGPIVHAKCRPDSTEDFSLNEMGNAEDGSPRKKMRVLN